MDAIFLYSPIDVAFVEETCTDAICDSEIEFRELTTRKLGLVVRVSYYNYYLTSMSSEDSAPPSHKEYEPSPSPQRRNKTRQSFGGVGTNPPKILRATTRGEE